MCGSSEKKLELLRLAVEKGTADILTFFKSVFDRIIKKGAKDKKRLRDKSKKKTPRDILESILA